MCEKVVVVQEGGYNTEFLKLHAEAVVKGLNFKDSDDSMQAAFGSPTAADLAAGVSSLQDIESSKACEWAVKNVEEVKSKLRPYWKCLQ